VSSASKFLAPCDPKPVRPVLQIGLAGFGLLKTGHRSKGLLIVNPLLLTITLSNKSALVPHNHPILSLSVLPNPLGSYRMAIWRWFN
jgi:hypothetical protein